MNDDLNSHRANHVKLLTNIDFLRQEMILKIKKAPLSRAFFLKVEYILNAPFGLATRPAFMNRTWGEVLQFSVFYDFATATNNDPLSNQDPNQQNRWINFKSIGLGLRFNIPGSINSRLMYANKIGVDQPNDNRYGRLWADFTYSF